MNGSSNIDLHTTFDAVLIGSGPINIIEAALLKSQGKRVLIIEERAHAAGAWTTIKHEHIPEVEIGCHIWDVDQASYDFLSQFFKLNLLPLSPRPRINKKQIRFPYDWKMNALGAKQILKRTGKLKFKALRQDFKSPVFRLSLFPALYLYPKNGAKDIKEGIQRVIDEFDIPILYQTKVNALTYQASSKGVQLKLDRGETLISQECVLTSLSSIKSFMINEEVLEFHYRYTDYVHMHLILEGYQVKSFSYDRVMDSKIIHRISDMSFQVKEDIAPNSKLLCVGIFEDAYKNTDLSQLTDLIIEELKSLKYISGNGQVNATGVNSFSANYNQPNLHAMIQNKTDDHIRVLRSTNFIYGIAAQLDRWQSLIK